MILEDVDRDQLLRWAVDAEKNSELFLDLDSLHPGYDSFNAEESPPTPSSAPTAQARQQTYTQRKRAERKRAQREKFGHPPTKASSHHAEMADVVHIPDLNAEDLKRVKTGYTGIKDDGSLPPLPKPESELTVEDLLKMGLRLVEWDGM